MVRTIPPSEMNLAFVKIGTHTRFWEIPSSQQQQSKRESLKSYSAFLLRPRAKYCTEKQKNNLWDIFWLVLQRECSSTLLLYKGIQTFYLQWNLKLCSVLPKKKSVLQKKGNRKSTEKDTLQDTNDEYYVTVCYTFFFYKSFKIRNMVPTHVHTAADVFQRS